MRVVTPGTSHSFEYIPRQEPSGTVTMTIRSGSENKSIAATVSSFSNTYSNGQAGIGFTTSIALKEGQFYNVDVLDDGELIWRGLLFCTAQTDFPKYSLNSGKFTQFEDNNNQFIVIND